MPGPPTVGPLEVTVQGSVDGWLLTHVIPEGEPGITGIVDREGRWVWWTESELGVFPMSGRLSADGRAVVFGEFEPTNQGEDRGRVVRVDVATGAREETRLVRGHHDFVVHDDAVAFLSLHTADVGAQVPLGFDRVDEVPWGAGEDTPVRAGFDTLSDSPVEPSPICSHIEQPRAKFGERVIEWTHANSLVWEPEEQVYYLNAKWTDWVVKIDRATSEPLWVMNGSGGEFRQPNGRPAWLGPDASALWSHGHMSEAWPGGFLMFDNGIHHPEGGSAVVEIAYDEGAREAEQVWRFEHPEGLKTPSMGDAKRLPSGNVISAWADLSELIEVSPEGEVVWRAHGPEGAHIGRTTWLGSLQGLGLAE